MGGVLKATCSARGCLQILYRIEWFVNCGKCDAPNVAIVKNIHDAEKYYTSLLWETEKGRVMNRFRNLYWPKVQSDDEKKINKQTVDIEESVKNLLLKREGAIFKNLPELKNPRRMREMLKLDLTAILCEVDSKDIVEPIFFYPILYPWYKKGFMPCGRKGRQIVPRNWSGQAFKDFPEGQIRVF